MSTPVHVYPDDPGAEHDTNGGCCWCDPEPRCAECDSPAPCIHGTERPTVVVHRQDDYRRLQGGRCRNRRREVRAQLRFLRQCRDRVGKLKDEASKAALARVIAATAHRTNPEPAANVLIHAGLDYAARSGKSWAAAMNYILDGLEKDASRAS